MSVIRRKAVQVVLCVGTVLSVIASAGCVEKTFVEDHSSHDLVTLSTDIAPGSAESVGGNRTLTFISLDDKALTSYWLLGAPNELKFNPGVHVFRVIYRHRTYVMDQTLEADFSSGLGYQLHEGSEDGAPRLWLTIAGTDKRVKTKRVLGSH